MEMEEEAYDLWRVETRLASMEAARVQRRQARRREEPSGGASALGRRVGDPVAPETSDVAGRTVTSGFDLLEASGSSDGSNSDSDCGDEPPGRRRGGLKDSLELSMSMSMAEPPTSGRANDRNAPKPAPYHRQETAGGTSRSSTVLRGADMTPPVVKKAPPVPSNEDWCASKLVQWRRQLEQEAKQRVSTPPQHSSKELPSELPTSSKPEKRTVKPTAVDAEDAMTQKQHAWTDVREPSTTIASKSALQGDKPLGPSGIPRRAMATTRTDTTTRPQVEPSPAEPSKAPNTAVHVSKPPLTTKHSGAQRSTPAGAKCDATVLGCAGSSSQQKSDLVEPTAVHDLETRKANHGRAKGTVLGYTAGHQPERRIADREPDNQQLERSLDGNEADLLSEEERLLRESLDKLDRRLMALSSLPPTQKPTRGPAANPPTSQRSTRQSGSGGSAVSPSSVDNNDADDLLRAASYGGGTHCRSGQVAPAATRSSSSKRAELSSGVLKSRVRVGGPLVQEASRSGGEPDGQHKVTIKKNLVHLLFQ